MDIKDDLKSKKKELEPSSSSVSDSELSLTNLRFDGEAGKIVKDLQNQHILNSSEETNQSVEIQIDSNSEINREATLSFSEGDITREVSGRVAKTSESLDTELGLLSKNKNGAELSLGLRAQRNQPGRNYECQVSQSLDFLHKKNKSEDASYQNSTKLNIDSCDSDLDVDLGFTRQLPGKVGLTASLDGSKTEKGEAYDLELSLEKSTDSSKRELKVETYRKRNKEEQSRKVSIKASNLKSKDSLDLVLGQNIKGCDSMIDGSLKLGSKKENSFKSTLEYENCQNEKKNPEQLSLIVEKPSKHVTVKISSEVNNKTNDGKEVSTIENELSIKGRKWKLEANQVRKDGDIKTSIEGRKDLGKFTLGANAKVLKEDGVSETIKEVYLARESKNHSAKLKVRELLNKPSEIRLSFGREYRNAILEATLGASLGDSNLIYKIKYKYKDEDKSFSLGLEEKANQSEEFSVGLGRDIKGVNVKLGTKYTKKKNKDQKLTHSAIFEGEDVQLGPFTFDINLELNKKPGKESKEEGRLNIKKKF